MKTDDINEILRALERILFPIFTNALVALCAFAVGVSVMSWGM